MNIWDDDYDGDRPEEYEDDAPDEDEDGDYYEPQSAFLDLTRL